MIGKIVKNKFKITPYYFDSKKENFGTESPLIKAENNFLIIGHTKDFDKKMQKFYQNDWVYLFDNKIFACSEDVFINFTKYFKVIKHEKDVKTF